MDATTGAPAGVLRGVGWMLLAALAASTLDATVKGLSGSYSTPQIVLLRLIFGLPFMLLFAHLEGGLRSLRPRRWRWHAFRALSAAGAIFGFFAALAWLPLMTAVSISFAAPLLVALLSRPMLGEAVGLRRWAGVVVGFGGVLLIVQPGGSAWHPAMLAGLGAALCWALLSVSARRIGHDEPLGALVVFTMPVSLLLAAVLTVGQWAAPEPRDWGLFVLAGACGGSVHFCVVLAYRRARAATLAPLEYTALLWATLYGYLIWGEVPSAATVLGTIIVVASGITVLRGHS